jgi:hypothetical protein
MDNTIAIDCFHCEQYCRIMRGIPLLCFFFIKNCGWGLPSLPKAIRSNLAAGPNAIGFGYQVKPKTLPKRANNVRSCYSAEPKSGGSGSAEQTQNTSKGGWVWLGLILGLVVQSYSKIYYYLYYKYFKFYYY